MRPLGWNPQLLPEGGWAWLGTVPFQTTAALVAGEAALAAHWLHHRPARQLEVVALDESAWQALREGPCGDWETVREYPGFWRGRRDGLEVDLSLEAGRGEDLSWDQGVPAESLPALAVDCCLKALGGFSAELLLDLYFLARARVDLVAAARAMKRRDMLATQRALAGEMYAWKGGSLATPPVRPVEPAELERFRTALVEKLALETFED